MTIEVFIFLALVLAIFAVESKDLMYSVLALSGYGFCLGIIFHLLGAPILAIFQIAVFVTGSIFLGYVILSLTREGEYE